VFLTELDQLGWAFPLLQDLIPIPTVLGWKANQENELPSCLAGHACHCGGDHIYQHAPRFIRIERRHDFGSLRQPGDGGLDQARLFGIGFATQAGIASAVLDVREQQEWDNASMALSARAKRRSLGPLCENYRPFLPPSAKPANLWFLISYPHNPARSKRGNTALPWRSIRSRPAKRGDESKLADRRYRPVIGKRAL